jgi:hypothetical protein
MMAAAIAGCALPVTGIRAQDQAIVGIQTVTTYSADVRITADNTTPRTVMVTYPDRTVRTHNVCPAVANFGATRIGDNVTISLEDQLTFVLSGRNTPTSRSALPARLSPVAPDRSVVEGDCRSPCRTGFAPKGKVGGWLAFPTVVGP